MRYFLAIGTASAHLDARQQLAATLQACRERPVGASGLGGLLTPAICVTHATRQCSISFVWRDNQRTERRGWLTSTSNQFGESLWGMLAN